MSHEFHIGRQYSFWTEIILSILCLISLICASVLTHATRRLRRISMEQGKLMIANEMGSVIHNSPDYALTECVLFMAVCDVIRSIIVCFQRLRYAFNFWTSCAPHSFSGYLCLSEEFMKWLLISNDILIYGVLCFCLFRYLRKRSIFTASVTPQRIQIGVLCISVTQSAIQITLAILYETSSSSFDSEIIYIPSVVVLHSTILYIIVVFSYIRCFHPFWILGRATKLLLLYLTVFTLVFILPITLKMILTISAYSAWFDDVYLVSDILLSLIGTGNFLAWYFPHRSQHSFLNVHDERLFHTEDSLEMSADVAYVLDIDHNAKTVKKKQKKNGDEQRQSMFSKISVFSSPSKTFASSQGGRAYRPPTIDVTAMEPVATSASSVFGSYTNPHTLFVDSTANVFPPQNVEEHINNEYGASMNGQPSQKP